MSSLALMPSSRVRHSQPEYVSEWDNEFLSLFPHRFDYIWADHTNPGERVEWKTESRHPLSDRLIQQGAYLYGVRFGAQTQYCLLDIDLGSQYHPRQDVFAISRITAALEPLGLVSYIACTSSYSGGLHLYFPFEQPQSSWQLAIAVSTLLENAGFKIKLGQLEIFPDPKPYGINGKPSLFNAHRLPLQIGSYLVDADFQPVWSTQQSFVQQWQMVQARNDVEAAVIRRILKQAKRERYTVSTKAEKFINDLNAEIELGWTDFGQTNYLLGRITMREYIFRHILTGGKPLEGNALVQAIVEVARSLPGYSEYCRHRHEIEHRAQEWAHCIENSHYFHYGDPAGKFKAPSTNANLENAIADAPNWNQQQLSGARDRIRWAIAQLLDQGILPANATSRFHALVGYSIGGGTLYKHKDLWHPEYLTPVDFCVSAQSNEFPPHPPVSNRAEEWDCQGASHSQQPASLFPGAGSNQLPHERSSDLKPSENEAGGNNDRQKSLLEIKAAQAACREARLMASEQRMQIKQQASEARQIARMQQFLESNDPILMAEAIAWSQMNPGVLNHPPTEVHALLNRANQE